MREPIAIVGIGCRFPGAHGPRAFWRLLRDGVDAIGDIPPGRFEVDRYYDPEPATPGRITTRWGGFLDDADKFDADFFGISPREADRLDPQQRWLMETACEALDDAGARVSHLHGTQTGVFIGMWTNEYEARLFRDPRAIDFYMTVGSGRYSASGRLSYLFGLQGPSLTLDTGCSASLVAVHLACQSLWTGETTLALAGGVNAILEPSVSIAYSQSRMVAPDGRCKFGDARADGYVRSEGAGLVVLKRLSDAVAAGDRVYALIRGSAVNNDGRSSGFLTTPGGAGQEQALRLAYRAAGVSPGAVDYVEAHGTGTRAGDPVEIQAIGAVMGEGRAADAPCRIGSVKTNIGHTESAAGVAGLIKVALALYHGGLPASLQVDELNPEIPWDTLPVMLQRRFEPWPLKSVPRYAGVSSLGIAGTNAHVVLSSADHVMTAPPPVAAASRPHFMALSAHSEPALTARLQQLRHLLTADESDRPRIGDLCWTLAARATHHAHRATLACSSERELIAMVDAILSGEPHAAAVRGVAAGERSNRIVFVFPGQGSQWLGMGRQLLEREPAFRDAIAECDRAIAAETGWSVIEQLRADESCSRLREIDVVQPVLFSVEVALAALWRSWGFEPAAVVGHSMGEVAAAHVAGILSIEQAAQIICRRSRLLLRASGKGAMALVELTIEQAETALRGRDQQLAVAVSNSTRSTVISGDPGALDALLQELEGREVFCRRIKVDVASHSPQMDPLRADLLAALEGLQPSSGAVPICSTVTGEVADGLGFDAHYWVRNLRAPVLFSTAMARLLAAGHDTFIEMSPHPILVPAMQEGIAEAQAAAAIAIGSTLRNEDEQLTVLSNVGALFVRGCDVNFGRIVPPGQMVSLPPYPWQRERYWFDAPSQLDLVTGSTTSVTAVDRHAYIGAPARIADRRGTLVWNFQIDPHTMRNFTGDDAATAHVPAAVCIDAMVAAGRALAAGETVSATDVVFGRPLAVNSPTPAALQMVAELIAPDTYSWRLYSSDGHDWNEHARAQLHLGANVAQAPAPQCDGRAAAELQLPHHQQHELPLYRTHPALLQRALNELASFHTQITHLSGIQRITSRVDLPADISVRVTDGDAIAIGDSTGRECLRLDGVRAGALAAAGAPGNLTNWMFETRWVPSPVPSSDGTLERWVLTGENAALAATLAAELRGRGYTVDLVAAVTAEHVRALVTQHREPLVVVHLVKTDAGDAADTAPAAALSVLATVRAVAACESLSTAPRLWVVTEQAQQVAAGDVIDCAAAPVWGLMRAVAEEHPLVWRGVVDVEIGLPHPDVAALAAAVVAADAEDQIAIRRGQRFALRLARANVPPHPLAVRSNGAYLIAGGLGQLGLQVARWLVDNGARCVALLSRRGLPPRAAWPADAGGQHADAIAAIREMENAGAEVVVAAADVGVRADVDRVCAELERRQWRLSGVFQCAGVSRGQLLAHVEAEDFDAVWRSKVAGSWNLLDATALMPLDCFVMFSSIAALLPFPGQASYAAANAFLDAAAVTARMQGRRVLAIGWGQWADIGMAAELNRRGALSDRRGFNGLAVEQGLNALGRVAGEADRAQLAVMSFNWREWRPGRTVMPLFTDLAAEEQQSIGTDSEAIDLAAQLSGAADEDQRIRVLETFVQAQLASVLKRAAAKIDLTTPMRSMGLDSLMALELRNRIEGGTGLRLPATLVWNHPTVVAQARFLHSKLAPRVVAEALPPAAAEVADDDLEQLLAEIEQLSDEQARRLAVEGQ